MSEAGKGRLSGRHVIVTGGASGIGKAMAQLFHREGARLALIDVNEAALLPVAKELDAVALPLDLGNAGALAPAVDRAAEEMGGLDGLVNCAAIGIAKPIGETDRELLSQYLAINLTAPYLLAQAALPHMRKAKGASIVNIASAQGLLPNTPNNTAYAMTKAGIIGFTKALAAEAAPHVRVNAIAPGVTGTPMINELIKGYNDPAEAPFVRQLAMKRVAEPVEIANGVLFLLSDEASFVTGSALAVDGGRCFH
jgi:NAD(P)-dependent dehydrogenase (short-subunit alcohol dehydrogenase family)